MSSLLDSFAPSTATVPSLKLSIGSASADDWGRVVVSLVVEAGLAPAVDVVVATVAAAKDAPTASVDDDCSVELGSGDDTTKVFTGKVQTIGRDVHGRTRIVAANGGGLLAALRVNQSYDGQSAGAVVRDLVSRAGARAGSVADGIALPYYVVDDRSSGYRHVARLARLSGCVAYVAADGTLTVETPSQAPPEQTFAYAKDVLGFETCERTPAGGAVTAVGEGAAGTKGDDAWSWLAKDVSSVSSTSGDGGERLLVDAALRSSGAARTAAGGESDALGLSAVTGVLVVPGSTKVAVGRRVAVSDAPDGALNGTYLVLQVRHGFTKRGGFTTRAVVGKAGGGALGALGGLP